jgi:hypothetical protein
LDKQRALLEIVENLAYKQTNKQTNKQTKSMSDKIPPPRQAFARSLSTFAVTALRLLLILTPHYHDRVFNLSSSFPTNWIYNPSLISIFIKPHWTLNHVKEARAIQQLLSGNFVNAYQANQSIRLPPLVLAALSPLLSLDNPELWLALILLLVDFGIAYLLEALGRQVLYGCNSAQLTKEEEIQRQLPKVVQPAFAHIFPIQRQSASDEHEPPLFHMASLPLLAAQLYYGCPITMLASGLYYCFQTIPCLLILLGLHESSRPRASYSLACFWVALACYMELHNAVFLMPVLLWLAPTASTKHHILVVVFFLTWSASLQGLSFGLVGPSNYWNVLEATYGVGWKTMSPNLSVKWYFQMQLFTRFRDYFGILLGGLPYLLVIPLTIRLHAYPMVLVRKRKRMYLVPSFDCIPNNKCSPSFLLRRRPSFGFFGPSFVPSKPSMTWWWVYVSCYYHRNPWLACTCLG